MTSRDRFHTTAVFLTMLCAWLLCGLAATAQDGDGDGVLDAVDNCPAIPNPTQDNGDASVPYDLTTDGTLLASDVGSLRDPYSGFVDASDGERGHYYLGNIIDGETSAGTVTQNTWMTSAAAATITVRFPTARVINKIILTDVYFSSHANQKTYAVEYSLDTTDGFDGSWSAVPGGAASGTLNVNGLVVDIDLTVPIAPRYIRVVLARTSGSFMTLNEIEVEAGDYVGNACDLCPGVPGNLPDGCPAIDSDGDGVLDNAPDNCPFAANPGQDDADSDGVGDACDNCPADSNPSQANSDALQYLLWADGTQVASSVGAARDSYTGYVDSTDGDRGHYYVGNLIDGQTTANTRDGWMIYNLSPAVLTVKLPAAEVIGKVVLHTAAFSGHMSNEVYDLEYSSDSTDGFDGTWLPMPAARVTGNIYYDQPRLPITIDLDTPIATRFLRVNMAWQGYAYQNYLTLNEIELFGSDQIADACDACPAEPGNLPDGCAFLDSDNDGFSDATDNCPLTANADQADFDSDGIGDVCDNCPNTANALQTNGDVAQYDLVNDGTMVASSVGDVYDVAKTGFVDSSDGNVTHYYVGNLIDGHKTTSTLDYWRRHSVAAATITVKQPTSRVITKLVLGAGSFHASYWRYEIEYSTDTTDGFDGAWQQIPPPKATGRRYADQDNGPAFDMIIPLDTPILTRYFRIQMTRLSTSYPDLTLNEIEIYGGDALGDVCDDCPAEAGIQATGCNNQPPTALCQNISVQLDAAGNATVDAADVDGGSSDPDLDSLTLLIDGQASLTFTCADEGDNLVTLNVDDGNGGSDDCTATVTITDAGACPDLQGQVVTAICTAQPSLAETQDVIDVIDATIDAYYGDSIICGTTKAACRLLLLQALGLAP